MQHDDFDDLEGDDILQEEEGPIEQPTVEPKEGRKPSRIFFLFLGVEDGDLEDVVDAAIDDAEKRGLFFSCGSVSEMSMDDVVKGSPLHQALTGQEPR